jgi:SAM-dependent methyltransferase
MVAEALAERHPGGGALADVGCGAGALWPYLSSRFHRYVGIDLLAYKGFPPEGEFRAADLSGRLPLDDGSCAVVAAVETIEHLENPRAFMRELVRATQAGGWVVVTTPNQLSWTSKLCLVLKNEFVQFQERPGLYPAHLSALLEVDLIRLARENGLRDAAVRYSGEGRVPGTARHWPRWQSSTRGWRGRAFSDNVLLVGRKPPLPHDA